jgi:hypothetical protein
MPNAIATSNGDEKGNWRLWASYWKNIPPSMKSSGKKKKKIQPNYDN